MSEEGLKFAVAETAHIRREFLKAFDACVGSRKIQDGKVQVISLIAVDPELKREGSWLRQTVLNVVGVSIEERRKLLEIMTEQSYCFPDEKLNREDVEYIRDHGRVIVGFNFVFPIEAIPGLKPDVSVEG